MNGIKDLEKEDEFKYEKQMWEFLSAKVIELFSGFRLLYLHIFFFILGIVLIYFVIKSGPKLFAVESILYGICFGFIYGVFEIWHLSRNIVGNLYYRHPLSLKRAIYAIAIGIIISNITIFTYKLLKSEYYKYIFLPCAIAIPIGELITIIWLINYEKIHGEVFIVQKK